MNAHPHADWPPAECRLRLCGGGEGAVRLRKRDEEGIALRVDLDAAVRREGFAHEALVLGERSGVGLGAELVEQPRRALDVGEEEGDDPGRQRPHMPLK